MAENPNPKPPTQPSPVNYPIGPPIITAGKITKDILLKMLFLVFGITREARAGYIVYQLPGWCDAGRMARKLSAQGYEAKVAGPRLIHVTRMYR